jgi:hypothetical protein
MFIKMWHLVVVLEGGEDWLAEECVGKHAACEDVHHGADPQRERVLPGVDFMNQFLNFLQTKLKGIKYKVPKYDSFCRF